MKIPSPFIWCQYYLQARAHRSVNFCTVLLCFLSRNGAPDGHCSFPIPTWTGML